MAHLLNPDGTPAQFQVNDNLGNSAVGHFEFNTVPSFQPGTRLGDLTFVIDKVVTQSADPQAPTEILRGSVG